MRNGLLTVMCCWVSSWALAQAPRPTYGQQLEAVHSVASAKRFTQVLEAGGVEIDTDLDSLARWQQQYCYVYQIHSDSIGEEEADKCVRYPIDRPAAWTKADFDHDGQPDLLLVSEARAYAVLNRGGQLPEVLPLVMRGWHKDCRYFQVVPTAAGPAVLHWNASYLKPDWRAEGYEPQLWQDTLVYRDGAFVEYNPHPMQRLPRSVSLGQGGSITSTFSFGMTVRLKSGKVKSSVRIDREHDFTGDVTYRLSAGALDTLRRRLAYLDIAHLQKEYSLGGFDHNVVSLTLHYPHQPEKEIDDYGGKGTYGLREIYSLLGNAQQRAIALQVLKHPERYPKPSPED